MQGKAERLVKYLEGSDKRFIIPVYQRNYDWRMEHCRQLYDDLIKIARDRHRSHFFGSLVSVSKSDGNSREEHLIIDGQQRLTTVSLLFLAMYNLMDRSILASQASNLKERIYEEYLVDKWQPEETRIKLKPVKNDQEAFRRLFSDSLDPVLESGLTINYNYFYERIQKQEVNLDELYDAICRLEVINIWLDRDDNPQLIFESLNSTGLELSEGDKIRNFILMGLSPKEQEKYYEKYWNVIEIYTNYEVSAFIRDYLSIKQQAIPQQNKVYAKFKEYAETEGGEGEPLLKELLAYARRYEKLLGKPVGDRELDACISRLNRLGTTVTRPFFLEALRLHDEGKLSLADVTEIFLTVESYLFRRSICDLPTNALNKVFLALHREIMRYDGSEAMYAEKFKYALLSKRERARFPDDREFAAAFAGRDIYHMNPKNKVYLFERLENGGTAEDKDIYRHCDVGDYSIEHVMPQKLTPAWRLELGEDWEATHEAWLHRIANLTLTAYNSRYSNTSFREKKTMANGFEESGIRLNSWIAKKDAWTVVELQERSEHLKNLALNIWKAPVSLFEPRQKQLDSCTLADDASLTGRQIARFSFRQTEQDVTSWAEMFQRVIQMLYAEDKRIIARLAASSEDAIASQFSALPEGAMPEPKKAEIGDRLYVWINTSTQTKIAVLRRLFMLYDEDPADLIFYLRDEGNAAAGEAEGAEPLYRRFWEYALPVIQASNAAAMPAWASPPAGNWLAFPLGVAGAYMYCVAKRDGARVELVFQKREKEENRKVFDALLEHKEEIERALAAPLLWDREGGKTIAKISVELAGKSVQNQDDWQPMARFLAEWSKRFLAVLIPLVRSADQNECQ